MGVGVRVDGDGVQGRRMRGEERTGHTDIHTYIHTDVRTYRESGRSKIGEHSTARERTQLYPLETIAIALPSFMCQFILLFRSILFSLSYIFYLTALLYRALEFTQHTHSLFIFTITIIFTFTLSVLSL